MNLESILTILKKIIDICLVWVVFYYLLKNIRKNVKFSIYFPLKISVSLTYNPN